MYVVQDVLNCDDGVCRRGLSSESVASDWPMYTELQHTETMRVESLVMAAVGYAGRARFEAVTYTKTDGGDGF